MRAEEIEPQTWLITRGNGQASTHNYLIVGEKKAALIDTGLEAEDLRAFTATLTDKPIIVLHTHGHIDHIGNDQQFEEIMLHPQDFSLFQLHSSAAFRTEFFKGNKAMKWDQDQTDPRQAINQTVKLEPLTEGMIVDLGQRQLKVIENPGHTYGCLSLIEEDRKRIYTGDMICEKGVLLHFAESTDIARYKKSLEHLRSAIAPDYQLYPGHQRMPLSSEWIDAYSECAEELLALGKELMKSNLTEQETHEILFHSKGKATISYTREKILAHEGTSDN